MTVSAQKLIDTVLLRPQLVTDGATVTANLDCAGAAWASVRVNLSTEETTHANASTVSLLESDDTVVTNFATITADQSVNLETGQEVRYEVDLLGRKRYLRLSYTAGTGTGNDITVGSIGSLSRNVVAPASTTAMGDDIVVIV